MGLPVWPFGVTWRHRSRDRWTSGSRLSIRGPWWPSGTVTEIWRFKDNRVTSFTFWSHVTSSVTWPFDSRGSTFYGWPIVTMRLSCTVMMIFRLKYWTHRPGHRKKDERTEKELRGWRDLEEYNTIFV